VSTADLRTAVGALAAAALLARNWKARRNAKACTLAGGLLRAGWAVGQVERFLSGICSAAQDEEPKNRIQTVKFTAEKIKNGEHVTGWPTLIKERSDGQAEATLETLISPARFADELEHGFCQCVKLHGG